MKQEKIGKFIKEKRLKKNLTQSEFANILGVTERTVSNWENGIRMMDLTTATQIAKYFNVSTDYLLGVSDERNSSLDSDNIGYDDFTYAMHNESRDLTDEDKEMLLDMAKMLKNRIEERKRKE